MAPPTISIRQATPGQRNVVVNTARNLALSIPGAGYLKVGLVGLEENRPR